mmetsp:Transcript_15631/g.29858  ORF Transcript_15631/g.29858 Transcript_15631/m.29858 type:complete len:101 (-) Transcript_15631:55-357(-)
MSSSITAPLARRVFTAASRRVVIPRSLSTVTVDTAQKNATEKGARMARCGRRCGSMSGIAKVGVLGLATYGGYMLIQPSLSPTPPPSSPNTNVSNATQAS